MSTSPPVDGNSLLIAVVDDDASVQRSLLRLLHSLGFRARGYDSGLDFLHSREVHEPDCVLLDVHMPTLSGHQLLQEIRDASAKLPVVLMTGRSDVDFEARALESGADGCLRKPFDEDELLAALARATDRSGTPGS